MAEICYRTSPRPAFPKDYTLRPHLALGQAEAGVRRVIELVEWFKSAARLPS